LLSVSWFVLLRRSVCVALRCVTLRYVGFGFGVWVVGDGVVVMTAWLMLMVDADG